MLVEAQRLKCVPSAHCCSEEHRAFLRKIGIDFIMQWIGIRGSRSHSPPWSLHSHVKNSNLTRSIQSRVLYCRTVNFALSNTSTQFSNKNLLAAAAGHVTLLHRQRKKARSANPAQSNQTTNRKKPCWLFVWFTADGDWRPPLPQCKIKIFVLGNGSAFANASAASHHCCVWRMIHRLGTDWKGWGAKGGSEQKASFAFAYIYCKASSCRGGTAHVLPNKDISMVSILHALSRQEYIASKSVCETKWSMRKHARHKRAPHSQRQTHAIFSRFSTISMFPKKRGNIASQEANDEIVATHHIRSESTFEGDRSKCTRIFSRLTKKFTKQFTRRIQCILKFNFQKSNLNQCSRDSRVKFVKFRSRREHTMKFVDRVFCANPSIKCE